MDSVIAAVNFQFGMQIPARRSQDVKTSWQKIEEIIYCWNSFFFFQITSLTFVVIGFHYHVVYSVLDEPFYKSIIQWTKTSKTTFKFVDKCIQWTGFLWIDVRQCNINCELVKSGCQSSNKFVFKSFFQITHVSRTNKLILWT